MQFIQTYIETLTNKGLIGRDIAKKLDVSVSMVSSYKLHNYNPSLIVAKKVYKEENIVLHPYSEESLKYEISKDR